MRSLILSLALLAAPAIAQEAKPVGAVVFEACGHMYGVTVIMSDGSYVIMGRDDLPPPDDLTDFLKSLNTTVAGIEDPALCRVTT